MTEEEYLKREEYLNEEVATVSLSRRDIAFICECIAEASVNGFYGVEDVDYEKETKRLVCGKFCMPAGLDTALVRGENSRIHLHIYELFKLGELNAEIRAELFKLIDEAVEYSKQYHCSAYCKFHDEAVALGVDEKLYEILLIIESLKNN